MFFEMPMDEIKLYKEIVDKYGLQDSLGSLI